MQAPPVIQIRPESLVLCADGGYQYAQQLGIRPDCLVGDFDSYHGTLPDVEMIRHPIQKDDTDTMLAVKLGLARGCTEFVIYGGIGGRLDHTIANIQTLCWLSERGAHGILLGERDKVLLHTPGTRRYAREDGYFSVFAYGGICRGVSLRGTEYPLEDAELTSAFPLGVSNHITADTAEVSLESGLLLLVFSADA